MPDKRLTLRERAKEDAAAIATIKRRLSKAKIAAQEDIDEFTKAKNQITGLLNEIEQEKTRLRTANADALQAKKRYDAATDAANKEKATLVRARETLDEATVNLGLTKEMLADSTAGKLLGAYKDSKKNTTKTELVHWFGIGITGCMIVAVFMFVLWQDKNGFAAIPPLSMLAAVMMMLWRSMENKKVQHSEYEHKERAIVALVGFKRHHPRASAQKTDELVNVITRNPAERLKTNTDTVWSVLRELIKVRSRGGKEAPPL